MEFESINLVEYFVPADVAEAKLPEVGPVEAFAIDVRKRLGEHSRKKQKLCMYVGEYDEEAVVTGAQALKRCNYAVTIEPVRKHMTVVAAVPTVPDFVIEAPAPAEEAEATAGVEAEAAAE